MNKTTIFGKEHTVVERKSNKDCIELKDNEIIANISKKTSKTLLKDYLTQLLYDKLQELSKNMAAEGKIELFGNLDFEITGNIDNRKQRIAKLKGDRILIKLSTVALPETVLKYIIAHEIAHITVKTHTKRFWKTVELIYPNYQNARGLLKESGSALLLHGEPESEIENVEFLK